MEIHYIRQSRYYMSSICPVPRSLTSNFRLIIFVSSFEAALTSLVSKLWVRWHSGCYQTQLHTRYRHRRPTRIDIFPVTYTSNNILERNYTLSNSRTLHTKQGGKKKKSLSRADSRYVYWKIRSIFTGTFTI